MMDHESQLKLQAFVDGELPEPEAREVASWLAKDAEATSLLNELRNTRRALKEAEPAVRVPESREFYWSKIQREIERQESVMAPEPTVSLWSRFVRWLARFSVAAAALALLVWVGLEAGLLQRFAPDTEMTVADSGAFTYHDYANGTTLVWVSYPAER
jgi:anti-sigma factor RsiW